MITRSSRQGPPGGLGTNLDADDFRLRRPSAPHPAAPRRSRHQGPSAPSSGSAPAAPVAHARNSHHSEAGHPVGTRRGRPLWLPFARPAQGWSPSGADTCAGQAPPHVRPRRSARGEYRGEGNSRSCPAGPQAAIRGQVHAVAGRAHPGRFSPRSLVKSSEPHASASNTPHVDVVRDAAVEDDPRGGISPGHRLEIRPADERVGEPTPNPFQQSSRGPGKTFPTNATSNCLATSCRRWISASHPSGSHSRGRDPLAPEPVRTVALCREDEIEPAGLLQAPGEVHVRVDRPPGTGCRSGGRW